MHILELPSFFPPYGGLFCLDQSKALSMQGNTVRIAANVNLSGRMSPNLYLRAHTKPYMLEMDGIEVMRRETRGVPLLVRTTVRKWLKNTERLVDNYVDKYGKPDLIHAHCCMWAGVAAMHAAEKYGIPYVITEHLPYAILSDAFGKSGKDAWQIPYLKEAYRKAALVIPVSEEIVDDISCFVGKNYKWKYVSNTIDVDFFAYKERRKEKNNGVTLCCVADFVPRKGYDVLLPAVRRFVDEMNFDVRLIVVGRDTDSDEMRKMIECCGLKEMVDVRGKLGREGVREALYESDCFVFATRSEVQPLVVLEAMSTGIPVVCTEAIPQCERIDGACFVSSVDDVDGFARQLARTCASLAAIDGKALSGRIYEMASPMAVGTRLNALFSAACQAFGKDE